MVRDIGLWGDIQWTDEAIETVYQHCAGHPFVTRQFASFACEGGDRKLVDENRVVECTRTIQRDFYKQSIGKYFRESIWQVLHDSERECLNRILKKALITGELEEARSNLERFGLIDRRKQIQGKLFRSWVEEQ